MKTRPSIYVVLFFGWVFFGRIISVAEYFSAFCVISEDGTNIIRYGAIKGGWERVGKPSCLCLPHQGHPFCWIKYFRLIEVGFSLLLFPSIPPLFPLSPLLTRPTTAAAPPPPPLSCFSLHIPLLLFLPPSFLGRCGCSSHGNHWIHVCLIRMRSINNPAGWR